MKGLLQFRPIRSSTNGIIDSDYIIIIIIEYSSGNLHILGGKEFTHQYTLMRHLPTHTDERKFQCNTCGKGEFLKNASRLGWKKFKWSRNLQRSARCLHCPSIERSTPLSDRICARSAIRLSTEFPLSYLIARLIQATSLTDVTSATSRSTKKVRNNWHEYNPNVTY